MGELFKAGSIVPRRYNVKADSRKAQHHVTFGCDVEVTRVGDRVVVAAKSCGALFKIGPHAPSVMMKNGTRKKSAICISDVTGDFSQVETDDGNTLLFTDIGETGVVSP